MTITQLHCVYVGIGIMPLPPYSPELNPVEQIWQQLRRTDFLNQCFEVYAEIVSVCCQAWNEFAKYSQLVH